MESPELLDDKTVTLVHCVAHEFSNLMSIISGYTDFLIEDTPADSPLREHLAEIQAATQRAIELTRRLKQLGLDSGAEPQTASERTY